MKHLWLSGALLLYCPVVTAEIYKWVDKEGVVNFSDQKPQGVAIITAPPQLLKRKLVTGKFPVNDIVDGLSYPVAQPASAKQNIAVPVKRAYTLLSILEPEDHGTVHDNNGAIEIMLNLKPYLIAGDRFQVLLDGKPYGQPQTDRQLKLTGIDRGTHILGIEVQDKEGKTLISSPGIRFFLHKTRLKR